MVISKDCDMIGATVALVSAYVSNNSITSTEMSDLIASTHRILVSLHRHDHHDELRAEEEISKKIYNSITPDALISFLNGHKYKTFKRHLALNGLTAEQYRERYGLPQWYPMTAPNYSIHRANIARSIGLGQRRARV